MFKSLFMRLLGIFIQYTFLKSPSFELSQKVYAKREEKPKFFLDKKIIMIYNLNNGTINGIHMEQYS